MADTRILTSIHGKKLGLDRPGNLVINRDDAYGESLVRYTAYSNVAASTAISNTITETAFSLGYTIPANTLVAGETIDIDWQGIATATNGTDTLRIRVYIGGTSGTLLFDHAATDVADNNVFFGTYALIVRTTGASGTVVGRGFGKSIAAAEGTATLKDDILASTTLNTTAAQDITVSATWSAASASNSCRLDFLRVVRG